MSLAHGYADQHSAARAGTRSWMGTGRISGPAAAFVLAWGLPTLAGAQHPSASPPSTPLVFDGVTVVNVETGHLVPAQRVVIVGNRIQTIGGRKGRLPPGARVVDARGKYLIPGLWDMHTHSFDWTEVFYPLFLAYGVTGIRDAWSKVPLDTLVQWWCEILAGNRVGPPRQLLAGVPLGSQLGSVVSDSVRAKRVIDSLKAHGANFIKLYPFHPSVAAVVRRAGLRFGGHAGADGPDGGAAVALEASDSGMSIIDHASESASGGLDRVCLPPGRVEQCRPVAAHLRRNGTWWVPTLVVVKGVWAGRTFLDRNAPFWADATPTVLATGSPAAGGTGAARPEAPATTASADSAGTLHTIGALRVLREVGMPLLAGTDIVPSTMGNLPPGISLHQELEMLVAGGLTPLAALQTATLNPALMLQGTDSLGTVAPGKLADLVLLDANPLAAITNTTRIRAVVANGRYFDRAALDQLLTEAKATARRRDPTLVDSAGRPH